MSRLGIWLGVTAVLLLNVWGCRKPAEPCEVHGKISYDGKPVSAGIVEFVPFDGGDAITGSLAADGTFRVTGLPVGKYKVGINTQPFKNMAPPPASLGKLETGRPFYTPIPPKYVQADSSGLTYEVNKRDEEWLLTLE